MKYDILVKNCACLTPQMAIELGVDVAISGGRIAWVGKAGEEDAAAAETVLDGSGKLMLPGLVDAHTHTCQQLLRGRVIDEYPMLWTRFLVPFESNLTAEDVYWSVQLACVEMIKNGTTAFLDAGGVHMESAAESVLAAGMRAALCRSTMDMGGVPDSMKETPHEAMRHTDQLFADYDGKGDGRLRIWYGLRQILTCSPELIRLTAEHAGERRTGIHTHLCENPNEISYCLQQYRKRPSEVLEDCGALGPNFLAAHCALLNDEDILRLARRQVRVVHCPRSNLNNHGIPRTPTLLANGVKIALGTDGSAMGGTSLFDDFKTLRAAVKAQWGAPNFDPVVMPCAKVLELATAGGAAALGLEEELGAVAVGKRADLILLNLEQAHLCPTHDLLATVVTAGGGRDVTDSIIDGRLVMKDRALLTLDEERIRAECVRRCAEIAVRAQIS